METEGNLHRFGRAQNLWDACGLQIKKKNPCFQLRANQPYTVHVPWYCFFLSMQTDLCVSFVYTVLDIKVKVNPLNPELNPLCYLLALLAHHFLHVSRIRVKSLTIRLLMSYIYMEHLFLMFLDHTQRRTTVGRTPLDE